MTDQVCSSGTIYPSGVVSQEEVERVERGFAALPLDVQACGSAFHCDYDFNGKPNGRDCEGKVMNKVDCDGCVGIPECLKNNPSAKQLPPDDEEYLRHSVTCTVGFHD